ncbi:MAG: Holliday junction resolvase RuvX [Planctomycetota bacterium]
MRCLGVDLGNRRVGLAVSDEAGLVAAPLGRCDVKSLNDALSQVAEAAREYQAECIVVGHPRNLDGRAGKKAREHELFAETLRERGFTVELWDERLTSEEAERRLRSAGLDGRQRRQHIDALAAQILLQSFLQARGHEPLSG